MKKLLPIIILAIITSFIFSSCGRQTSVTKRKYNKGYYVSHSHKRGNLKSQQSTASIKHEKVESLPIINSKLNVTTNSELEQKEIITAAVTKPIVVQTTDESYTRAAPTNNFSRKAFALKQLDKIMPSKFYTQEVKKRLTSSSRSDSDALSLLWIVIIIVLILYLIGFLFDGYGFGGLFHLLAVIFVILLILWLLRVI
ncbi:MAG: hypothetical protein JNJ41_16920 [Bacteroidia bacterium]|nr:hypothetical protein [Bacteroidia bacterium]